VLLGSNESKHRKSASQLHRFGAQINFKQLLRLADGIEGINESVVVVLSRRAKTGWPLAVRLDISTVDCRHSDNGSFNKAPKGVWPCMRVK
jgi:hypothetical protein